MPKRFTETEAQRIFALAAERQHETGQDEPGLSLEELEEVGRAAGLDPAFVREAAIDALRPETTGTTRRVLGMPLEFRRERFIRGTVSDEAWAQIVVDLRRQFNKAGLVTDIGPLREWRTEAEDSKQPVTVTLTPEREGTRVVVEQSQANTALGMGIGFGVNFLMGLIFTVVSTLETGDPDMIIPGLIMLASALLFGLGAFFGMRVYGRNQTTKFDAVLDRAELAIRDAEDAIAREAAAAPVREPIHEAPRLDPGLLHGPDLGDGLPEAGGAPRSRDRA